MFSEFCQLLGDDYIDDAQNKSQLIKTEISLTLSNKFEVPENDDTDMKSLLIRYTKSSYMLQNYKKNFHSFNT